MKNTTPMAYLQVWAEGADANRLATGPLEHTASNVFRARGVHRGDRVFVAEVVDGQLELIGRMVVADVLSRKQAQKKKGYDVWPARDHLIAAPGASPITYGRRVDSDVAAGLRFLQKTGRKDANGAPKYRLTKLKFNSDGRLDDQTTRTVVGLLTNQRRASRRCWSSIERSRDTGRAASGSPCWCSGC